MPDRLVYMDNNATTPLHPAVEEIIRENLRSFGNPSSLHFFGRAVKKKVDHARQIIADFLHADGEELIFTGTGSEANNTVLNIAALCSDEDKPAKIITTAIEHPCVLKTSQHLFERGLNVVFLRVDKTGKIDMDLLKKELQEKTALVSIMTANNEIGTIQNIREITRIAHEYGALMHTDAVQAVGKIAVNVKELDVDFLTFSGHKFYGPKGIGGLYVKKGTPFFPFIYGGHQEKQRRAGTENTLGIIGLGRALEKRAEEMEDDKKRIGALKQLLKEGIRNSIEDVQFNGHPDDCLYTTLNVSFNGIEGEAILLSLDLEGIAVSTGSACSSGSLDPSHVLVALGLKRELAHGSIRFSMGRENSREDVDYVLEKLPPIIKRLRSMSSYYMTGGGM